VTSLLMSEFASNTAAASVVYPILLGSVSGLGLPSGSVPLLLMASSFGASFGFMLPVSTPPNAIVYGTGKLKLKDMIKAGVCFDLLGFLIITAWISVLLYW
ncbi:MAG: anion permease, partial [Bdellovibrionales bacterium]|nr:anion permease [Bdellovibrionales bacterium]